MKDKKRKKQQRREEAARNVASWNTDDIDFDELGRIVVKNPLLAREITGLARRDGGLTLHVLTGRPLDGSPKFGNTLCWVPLKCPLNRACPDAYCGELLLRVIKSQADATGPGAADASAASDGSASPAPAPANRSAKEGP